MKLKADMTINGRRYRAGEPAPLTFVYPFFLIHMGLFGSSGFLMAYSDNRASLGLLYGHGAIAITAYLIFYRTIFGWDQVRWMFINAGLGLLGIWAEIDIVLGWFGKSLSDYSPWVHVTPFLFYILYTFLLRQMVLDLTGSREDPRRRRIADSAYVLVSLLLYLSLWQLR